MPHRQPRPLNKLTDREKLSTALMERVGAMLRKTPLKDVPEACRIIRDERDQFMAGAERYATETSQAHLEKAVPFVLASIAANAVQRILDHEKTLADKALVDDLMKPLDSVANPSQPAPAPAP